MGAKLSIAWLLLVASAGCGVSQAEYNARLTDLERTQAELGQKQNELGNMQARYDQQRRELEERDDEIARLRSDAAKLAGNLQATQQEMQALRRAHVQAAQRNELYRTLMTRLRDAIGAGTLAVEVRKGKMLVKLGDQILFDPGSTVLKPEGQAALKQVAQALKEIPDRDFLVAGHTDNQPIKSSSFTSNWELSTERAVTVVRFLQGEGVDPRRLAAAGYSEFDAVADNATPQGRAQNRRIEIVVMPRIDELPGIDLTEPAAGQPTEPPPATTTTTPPVAPAAPAAPATATPAPPARPTP